MRMCVSGGVSVCNLASSDGIFNNLEFQIVLTRICATTTTTKLLCTSENSNSRKNIIVHATHICFNACIMHFNVSGLGIIADMLATFYETHKYAFETIINAQN